MTIANADGCTPYEVCRQIDIVRAEGAHLFDADDRTYVDLCNAFGSVLLGHGDPAVVSAVLAAVRSGMPAAATLAMQQRVAGRIAADIGQEWPVAFFKTGTAATRAAVVAARRATGRRLVASCGYHGYDPMWEFTPPGEPNEEGVLHLFHLPELLDRALAEHANELAAVIIAPEYLHTSPEQTADLFARCRRAGVVTIADEVKNGYRMRRGASIHGTSAEADIYVFSKCLGNGWPIACVVAEEDVLATLGEFASTLTFEPVSCAAALATLDRLVELDVQARLAAEGKRFVVAAADLLRAHDLPIEVAGTGASFQFVCAAEVEAAFLLQALAAGLVLEHADQQYPSAGFHGPVVEEALERLDEALAALGRDRPDLVGQPVTDSHRIQSAFFQMDGLPGRPAGWELADCIDYVTGQLDESDGGPRGEG